MSVKHYLFSGLLAALVVGGYACSDGPGSAPSTGEPGALAEEPEVEPAPEVPEGDQSAPELDERQIMPGAEGGPTHDRLSQFEELDRVVFYDPLELGAALRDGEVIDPNDTREIWRFSLPRAAVDAALATPGTTLDVGADFDLVWHGIDPYCDPHAACAMVTMEFTGGAGFTGVATRFIRTESGDVTAIFDVKIEVMQEGRVFGTTYYQTGARALGEE